MQNHKRGTDQHHMMQPADQQTSDKKRQRLDLMYFFHCFPWHPRSVDGWFGVAKTADGLLPLLPAGRGQELVGMWVEPRA